MVIELVVERLKNNLDIGEVHDPARPLLDHPPYMQRSRKRVPVQSATLVVSRNMWKPVGRLEGELLEDLHGLPPSGNPEHLVGLETQSPLRMGKAVLESPA